VQGSPTRVLQRHQKGQDRPCRAHWRAGSGPRAPRRRQPPRRLRHPWHENRKGRSRRGSRQAGPPCTRDSVVNPEPNLTLPTLSLSLSPSLPPCLCLCLCLCLLLPVCLCPCLCLRPTDSRLQSSSTHRHIQARASKENPKLGLEKSKTWSFENKFQNSRRWAFTFE
jgi:hypothetical protein